MRYWLEALAWAVLMGALAYAARPLIHGRDK